MALLRDALAHARTATELAPASLSCAALRATLLANLLVENSTAAGVRCGLLRDVTCASGHTRLGALCTAAQRRTITGCRIAALLYRKLSGADLRCSRQAAKTLQR